MTAHFGMKMNDSHIRKKIRFLLDLYFFLKWRKALVSEWLAHTLFGMTGALFRHDSLSPMTGPAPSFRKQGDFPSCHIGEEIIFPVIPKGIFQAKKPLFYPRFQSPTFCPIFWRKGNLPKRKNHLKKTSEILSFRKKNHLLGFGSRKSFRTVNHRCRTILSGFHPAFTLRLPSLTPMNPSFW